MLFGVRIEGNSSFTGWWVGTPTTKKSVSIVSDKKAALKFWTPWGAWRTKLRLLSQTKRPSKVRFLWNLF